MGYIILNAVTYFIFFGLYNTHMGNCVHLKSTEEILIKEITAKELEQKMNDGGNVKIIDVREDEEVAFGKIPSARHIPLGQIPDRHTELDKEQHYYMVCRSVGRSHNACAFLIENGYDVTNMTGGMMSWEGEVE